MHQSGHERAQSMQTVQLTSRRAMTPRARSGGASFSCGYCTVAAPPPIFLGVTVCASSLNVTPRPFSTPGTSFAIVRLRPSSECDLQAGRDHDVDQGDGDEELPGEPLQLVLPEPRVGETDEEDDSHQDEHLREQHDRPDDVHVAGVEGHAGEGPTAEEQGGGQGGEGAGRRELGDEERRKRKPLYSVMYPATSSDS